MFSFSTIKVVKLNASLEVRPHKNMSYWKCFVWKHSDKMCINIDVSINILLKGTVSKDFFFPSFSTSEVPT